jgi:hypothetical protein
MGSYVPATHGFWQAEQTTCSGIGVGLAIAKELWKLRAATMVDSQLEPIQLIFGNIRQRVEEH